MRALLFLVLFSTVTHADIVTIDEAKYAFNVMTPTAHLPELEEAIRNGEYDRVNDCLRENADLETYERRQKCVNQEYEE